MKKVFLVAGEASGDVHGSELAKALAKLEPTIEIHASGGALLEAHAKGEFISSAHLNATGLTAVLKLLPQYWKLFGRTTAAIRRARPDLVVFIDNPGFNLRLARRLLPEGIPMAYYICPQIWGWGEKRIEEMRRCFKKALVVFKFEEEFYRKRGMSAAWVGHPLKDEMPEGERSEGPGGGRRVLLLAGSREHEVKTLFPILVEAAGRIAQIVPDARFSFIPSPLLDRRAYEPYLARTAVKIEPVFGDKYEAMRQSDLAIACSGTVTLECALAGLPMIVVNRASLLTYLAVRSVIRVRYLGLPNLLADAPIVPELLQYDCTPARIAREAVDILTNAGRARKMREDLARALEGIGPAGASRRAAKEILALL